MTMRRFLARFHADRSALAAIEMAILAPVIIGMLLGLFQIGLYLQAQNALRGVGGDISRSITVEFQKGNLLNNDQIRQFAFAEASGAPYLLDTERLDVVVEDEAIQGINRVSKKYVTVSYEVPNIVGLFKTGPLELDLKRVVFVPGPEIVAGGDNGTGAGM